MGSEAISWHDPSQGPPSSWGDPTQFEWRGGWWWCRVCSQWADGFHVEGKRHQKRAPWADWYILCDGDGLGCEAISFDEARRPAILAAAGPDAGTDGPGQGQDPWGPSWEAAVKGHGACEREWPAATAARSLGEEVWRREWSEEHQQSYFWNEATGESRWDLPSACGGEVWC